jgi:hypothetical protein
MPNHENLQAVLAIIATWAAILGVVYLLFPSLLYPTSVLITVLAIILSALYFMHKKAQGSKPKPVPILIAQTIRNATLDVTNGEDVFRVHVSTISIANKPDVLENTARNVEVSLVWPQQGDLITVSLPWLTAEIKPPLRIDGTLDYKNPTEVIRALSSKYLKYEKLDIQQGVGHYAVAFFGLEATGKVYLANKDPLEVGEPKPPKYPALYFQLRVSGDNFAVVSSEVFLATAFAWDKIPIGRKKLTINLASSASEELGKIGNRSC